MSSSKKSSISVAHILFLIAGVVFFAYYLIAKGLPSVGNDLQSIMNFLVELFVLIVLVAFYFFFLFQAKNCAGSLRAFAPALLIFIVCGSYSLSFGSPEANAVIAGLAQMAYLLIVVCGFAFLFIHSKILGMVFSFSSVIYAAFVTLSYTIMAIIDAVNGNGFSVAMLFKTIVYAAGLVLLFVGGYKVSKNRDW